VHNKMQESVDSQLEVPNNVLLPHFVVKHKKLSVSQQVGPVAKEQVPNWLLQWLQQLMLFT